MTQVELIGKADPKVAERLRGYADGLDSKIEHKRKSNAGLRLTHRRQGQIDSANWDADQMEKQQTLLHELAHLFEAGLVPAHLAKVKTKKATEDLVQGVRMLERWNEERIYAYAPRTYASQAEFVQAIYWAQTSLNGVDHGDRDVQRKIQRLEQQAELNRPPGFFSTPPAVYENHMFPYLRLQAGDRVLEPEAGSGALADGIVKHFPGVEIDCIEIVSSLREILELKGYGLVGWDFLEFEAERPYDAIVMNPPFENGQDIQHVRHAYEQLADGGTLVSVMSPGPFFRTNGKDKVFRAWLEEVSGYDFDLPEGSFKPATGVATKVVVIEK